MSNFVVYEEPETNRSEFACQTDEICQEDVESQTVEETISNYRENKKNPEYAYWKSIVANQQTEVNRIKKINEKMEAEKFKKLSHLEMKQAEYKRLFDLGNEKLKTSDDDEKTEDEEEDDSGKEESKDCK